MPNKNKEKGDLLEKAVSLIQDAILKSDPKFAGTKFTIETNKIDTSTGVRHEIDVLIKTHPNSQYEAVWIFECKNWNSPVSKNDVIILTAKVNAIRANRGFLVAREFSSDAEAQAKIDSRITLVPCTDDFVSPVSFELVHLVLEPDSAQIALKERGVPPSDNPKQLDWRKAICRVNNELADFGAYVMGYVDEIAAELKKEGEYKYEGEHYAKKIIEIKFDQNEFIVDSMDVEWMTIVVPFWISVEKKKIISKFEVKAQGRFYSFEPIQDRKLGKIFQIDIVQRI